MAYSLSNKCTKNLCKRTVLVQLIIENVVDHVFFVIIEITALEVLCC